MYDESILCLGCEQKFGVLDDYGAEVLLEGFERLFRTIYYPNSTIAGFDSSEVDQKKLLRFMVAVLWRASVSSEPFYERVSLGSFEQTARRVITNPEEPVSNHFSVVLACWDASQRLKSYTGAMLSPFREKWGRNGINAYRFSFGKTLAYIKVDNRPFVSEFSKLELGRQSKLRIIARNFDESSDLAAMTKLVKDSERLKSEFKSRPIGVRPRFFE